MDLSQLNKLFFNQIKSSEIVDVSKTVAVSYGQKFKLPLQLINNS
jgi:hypothetical protein